MHTEKKLSCYYELGDGTTCPEYAHLKVLPRVEDEGFRLQQAIIRVRPGDRLILVFEWLVGFFNKNTASSVLLIHAVDYGEQNGYASQKLRFGLLEVEDDAGHREEVPLTAPEPEVYDLDEPLDLEVCREYGAESGCLFSRAILGHCAIDKDNHGEHATIEVAGEAENRPRRPWKVVSIERFKALKSDNGVANMFLHANISQHQRETLKLEQWTITREIHDRTENPDCSQEPTFLNDELAAGIDAETTHDDTDDEYQQQTFWRQQFGELRTDASPLQSHSARHANPTTAVVVGPVGGPVAAGGQKRKRSIEASTETGDVPAKTEKVKVKSEVAATLPAQARPSTEPWLINLTGESASAPRPSATLSRSTNGMRTMPVMSAPPSTRSTSTIYVVDTPRPALPTPTRTPTPAAGSAPAATDAEREKRKLIAQERIKLREERLEYLQESGKYPN
ncbi:hypothetical protein LTR95_010875 [Oleoguttula sp. CCFEE 5521]